MEKFKKAPFLVLMLILSLFLSNNLSVYEYKTMGYKWSSSTVNYYYDNYNSMRGKSYIAAGASAWSSTNATYSFDASYNIYTSEANVSNVSWDGLCSGSASGGYFKNLTIILNMDATNTWNDDGALKSVAVHEFGHGLGLDDNGTTKTIMNGFT